ncbi:MAG: NAD(P)-dependent oxidoreductase [Rhodomicrobium sp.]
MTKPSLSKVCFIGLGKMGWPMASRLAAAGFKVAPIDAFEGLADRFVNEFGGRAFPDAREAAAQAQITITMLPTSKQVLDVMEEIGPSLKPGTIVVEMSSGVPSVTKKLAAEMLGIGVTLIDAPVSGGVPRATTGDLAIMTGGDPGAIERVLPVLRVMGSTIVRVGDIGSGQAMKALNNLVSAGGFLIGIEALLIGQRFGLDPALMVDVLNAGSGMNNSTQKKFKQFVLSRSFNSGFSLDLMAKDLSIALEVASETATPVPIASLCRDLWAGALNVLGDGQDHTAMAKFSEMLAGSSLEDQAGPE